MLIERISTGKTPEKASERGSERIQRDSQKGIILEGRQNYINRGQPWLNSGSRSVFMKVRNAGVENWTDAPKIKIGICAMGKKTTSKECIIMTHNYDSS